MGRIKAWGLTALALLILLAACTQEGASPESSANREQNEKTAESEPAADGSQGHTDGTFVSFRQALKSLDFGQSGDTRGYMFLTLTKEDLPDHPYTIVRHEDKEFSIGLFLDAAPDQVRKLLEQIRVEGAHYQITNADIDPNRPGLSITDMEPEVTVTLGDLPPITIVKMAPLVASLEYEDPQDSTPGIFVHPSDDEWAKAAAVVPFRHPALVLRFSEEMDTSSGALFPEGEWIDAYRYRLRLPVSGMMRGERNSWGAPLGEFRSAKGNYLDIDKADLRLTWVNPAHWLDLKTGSRVGWSDYDPFYETIVFSPDGKSYVGTVEVDEPNGDGIGHYYRIMLEQKGKPAVTIEPYLYTGMLHQGSPAQWAGNDRVAYADHDNLYVYSLQDGTRTTLFSTSGTHRFIHYAAYDPWAKQWNVLTGTYDVQGTTAHNDYQADLYILDDGGRVISHQSEWSLAPVAEVSMPRHPVIPAKNGVYRTFYRDRSAFTRFEARDGTVTELPGAIQYADEHQAYLLDTHYSPDTNEWENILYVWKPGEKQPKAAAKAPGYIRFAGAQPIAETETHYYQYDAKADRWVRWASTESVSLSRQTFSGMYKPLK